ncbi:hypothetical protein GHT06_016625 [Daphnia sinensis]|uniref:Uncharacterized protein n=1 Tax=Daphnia sinensis TaxID=1820382 RepID=A0AAD5LFM9_9CRUS|nr:hypothetical protein GHT06_016625 [Daphnia sinensis]
MMSPSSWKFEIKTTRRAGLLLQTSPEWTAVVTLALVAVKLAWNFFHFIFTTFIGSWLKLNLNLAEYGPWSVVTGSTDGIGKAYAHKLASIGINVVLISRSPSKLEATAREIQTLYPLVRVKTVAVDFTGDRSIYKAIASELMNLDVGILINNVGMNPGFCQPFTDLEDENVLDDIIHCNVLSMTRMTHMILPGMIRRGRGVILNIGSISGAFATPLATVYAATKAFVDKFSRDLTTELGGTGVIVQTVLPGYVMTNMLNDTTFNKSSWTVPNPQDFVEANFRTLGLESRTASFWYHKLMLSFCETTCFIFPDMFSFFARKHLEGLRATNGPLNSLSFTK